MSKYLDRHDSHVKFTLTEREISDACLEFVMKRIGEPGPVKAHVRLVRKGFWNRKTAAEVEIEKEVDPPSGK